MKSNLSKSPIVYRDRRTHKILPTEKPDSSNEPISNKAILYIRVSTDEQADRGFSQRDQDQRLHEYCQRHNILIGQVIYEDYSAKTFTKRPAWTKLLSELKRSKGKGYNKILFTKWDRFSRNAADAYAMIDILGTLSIEPNAIDQNLDLKIPESRIMLAVYISTAEAENLRRGMNVVVGMRRARLEGRWMGTAPAGYVNKIDSNKHKYIEKVEPEASHLNWAFHKIAEGIYATDHVWKLAKAKGMKCSRNSFWAAIRNPVYCGKIIVPPDEHNEMFLSDGKHQPIITEDLFWEVQDILSGRKKTQSIKVETPLNLSLRGFVTCPDCERNLTGSPSKGRSGYYYYYHCKSPCRARFKADEVNAEFENELKKFVPKPGMLEQFTELIKDILKVDINDDANTRQQIIKDISEQNNTITKLRTLLLSEDLDPQDYKIMKTSVKRL